MTEEKKIDKRKTQRPEHMAMMRQKSAAARERKKVEKAAAEAERRQAVNITPEDMRQEFTPERFDDGNEPIIVGSAFRPDHVAEPTSHDQIGHAHQEQDAWEWPDTWVPASLFPEVEPRPDFENRWIAVEHAGKGADRNMARKFRYWRPISVNRLPAGSVLPQTAKHGSFGEVIYVQGMILCECPKRLMDQRRESVRARTNKQRRATGSPLRKAAEGFDAAQKEQYGTPQVYDKERTFTRAKPKPRDQSERPEVAADEV